MKIWQYRTTGSHLILGKDTCNELRAVEVDGGLLTYAKFLVCNDDLG